MLCGFIVGVFLFSVLFSTVKKAEIWRIYVYVRVCGPLCDPDLVISCLCEISDPGKGLVSALLQYFEESHLEA